jgi:hypothetical protein
VKYKKTRTQIVTKKPDKEELLKLSITIFIVTALSELQTRQVDGFCNIKADHDKK